MRMYEELYNKYRIEQLLGNGTYGAVFQAREFRCDRTVAIKTFHKDRYNEGTRRYLESEIRAMGRLWGHPNIVSIHTLEPGDEKYLAFLVMEYVDGPNLRGLMDRGPIAVETVLRIVMDVCRGLAHAHQQNIVHRDVKPQNILLEVELTAKLSDFGVARVLEQTNNESGFTVAGTRKYMAPEQYLGKYDHRVDLYATGLILFEMLAREFPFNGHHSKEIEAQKQNRDPAIPESIPPSFHAVVRRALAREPSKRYQSAQEMIDALESIRSGLYRDYVVQVMERYQGSSMLESILATRRAKWGLTKSDAYVIEQDAARELEENRRQAQHSTLAQKTADYYGRSRRLVANERPQEAIAELQKLVLLHISDEQTSRLVSDLFVRLADENFGTTPGTSAWLVAKIRGLPEEERAKLMDELGVMAELARPPESLPTDVPMPVLPQRIAEIEENERRASYYQRKVEECRRVGNLRRARRFLKKVGRIYRGMAEAYSRAGLLEQVTVYYMRAARAYGDAMNLGARFAHTKSRRCYIRAAKTHSYLGDGHYRQQEWLEAGDCYRKASRSYDQAEKRSAYDEANRQAVLAYYQAAQELFRQGNVTMKQLGLARNTCQTAVNIAYHIRGQFTPADQARKLLVAIETAIQERNQREEDAEEPIRDQRRSRERFLE